MKLRNLFSGAGQAPLPGSAGAPARAPTPPLGSPHIAAADLQLRAKRAAEPAVPLPPDEDDAAWHRTGTEPGSGPDLTQRLCDHLGLDWTRHNPVWTPMALRLLRDLQKALLEAAIQQRAEERGELLAGVQVIERQVQLRLRMAQLAEPLPDMRDEPGRTAKTAGGGAS